MAGETIDSEPADSAVPDWRLRPWLLAGLLGFGGLLIHLVTNDHEVDAWRVAPAAFVFFGALAAAFTLEKGRWREPAVFAVVIGLVMSGLAWRAVRYGEHLPDEQYGFAAGVVATALALPLFQAGFRKRRFGTPYTEIYHHIWTDAISAAGGLAFTGLSWVALAILAKLFELLKIDFLRDLMEHGWFAWTFSGLAFGAALGVLRNELKVLGMLRTVVLLVLSLLAVPLAVGLVMFLLATAVSGPQVLWEATREATPTLLACAAGAFVLTCVLVRQDDEAMTRNPVMRAAALALAVVILPLAMFAAVSLGLRLNQYGLAPERLWGLVTVIVACAWGVGYWGALIRGRKAAWAQRLREANFLLAVASCVLALLLALPLLDFGTVSAGNQLQRLESGKVTPDKFDFAALRWDFGVAGKRALARLAKSRNPRVAQLAQAAIEQKQKVYFGEGPGVRAASDFPLRVQPDDPALRRMVLAYLEANSFQCQQACVAVDLGSLANGRRKVALVSAQGFTELELSDTGGSEIVTGADAPTLKPGSNVEIRDVSRRYIFVDGKPMLMPLDD
ncbi:MAG: DUF4153 domain-containing protein [Croceibacterium sp.]